MAELEPKMDADGLCDVRLWTEGPDRLAARANVTYALPG